MRLVIDTNVLISALISERSLPAHLIVLWRQGRFVLLTSKAQLEECRRVTRYEKLRAYIKPALAGRLINDVQDLAELIHRLPTVTICNDPNDNYLLAMAEVGRADFLISGDKRDLITMQRYRNTQILTARDFLFLQKWLP